MRTLALLSASALTFALWPVASRLDALAGAGVLVAMGVLLAAAASEGFSSTAVAAGALGALSSGVLGGESPMLGAAVLVAFAYAERTSRVSGRGAKAAHLALAALGGGVSGGLAVAYVHASPGVHVVAVVVAAVLAALPVLLEADDAIAHALDAAAQGVGEPAKNWLREAAEIRREAREAAVDRTAAAGAARSWRALLKLAEVRLRSEKRGGSTRAAPASGPDPYRSSGVESAQALVDQRIADLVRALPRT
jgi:hypothetical protein